MISQNLHEMVSRYAKILQRFTDRTWYPPFIGLLAALDNLLIIIPNDGILISSSMLIPRRWLIFALSVTIGSTMGAVALAILVEVQGLPWILEIYPGLNEGRTWLLAADFFEKFGLLLVFLVGLSPLAQQPAIILASLANTPLVELSAVVFFGRLVKYLTMAYVGSHAPRFLSKIWGIKEELKDVGIKIK